MRVVIADDVLLVRAGEAQLLRSVGVEVVAECADAEELLRAVALESPHAAIVDIRMPPTHTDEGLVAAQRIRRLHPRTAVLVLSQYLEPAYASRLLADEPAMTGYLLKERVYDVTVLVDALERIVSGSCVIDDAIVERLVERRRGTGGNNPLTDREAEVLELIAAGRSNAAIGDQLCISTKTVETLVSAVFRKLGLEASPSANRRVLAVLSVLARP